MAIHALSRVEYEIRDGQIVYADHGSVGVMVTERNVGAATEPTLDDLRGALIAVYGTDFGIHDPTSITRFTDAARQAAEPIEAAASCWPATLPTSIRPTVGRASRPGCRTP